MPKHKVRFVERVVVEAVHFDLLLTYGGMRGLRDESALESALARPRHKASYEKAADVPALAAAYGFGLARNHPFNDGNKRVAFVVMAVFLGLNGHQIVTPESDVVAAMIALADGTLSEDGLAEWVRARMVAL